MADHIKKIHAARKMNGGRTVAWYNIFNAITLFINPKRNIMHVVKIRCQYELVFSKWPTV